MSVIVSVIAGTLGAVGFYLLFGGALKRLPYIVIIGAVSSLIMALSYNIGFDDFFANFLAAITANLVCRLFAIVTKSASTIYIVAALIPLVPGGRLYYAMRGIVSSDYSAFIDNLLVAGKISVGIAFGILVASVIIRLSKKLRSLK